MKRRALVNPRLKVLEDKVRQAELEHDVQETAAKISALKSGDIDKYELLTETDVIPRGAEASLAAAKFEYSPLGKAFDKQVKAIEEQGNKQVAAIKSIPTQQRPQRRYVRPARPIWRPPITTDDESDYDYYRNYNRSTLF